MHQLHTSKGTRLKQWPRDVCSCLNAGLRFLSPCSCALLCFLHSAPAACQDHRTQGALDKALADFDAPPFPHTGVRPMLLQLLQRAPVDSEMLMAGTGGADDTDPDYLRSATAPLHRPGSSVPPVSSDVGGLPRERSRSSMGVKTAAR